MVCEEDSPCFRFLYQFLGEGSTGVEIGVADGGNAMYALPYLKPTKYYLVDPWKLYTGYNSGKFTQEDFDEMYALAVRRMEAYPAAQFFRTTSEEAAKVIPDELDFVYIDGNHAYDFKMLDMECWYPKVRSGGVLCGDDYNIEDTQRVVRDFCDKYNLTFEVSTFTHPHALEFWIVKP